MTSRSKAGIVGKVPVRHGRLFFLLYANLHQSPRLFGACFPRNMNHVLSGNKGVTPRPRELLGVWNVAGHNSFGSRPFSERKISNYSGIVFIVFITPLMHLHTALSAACRFVHMYKAQTSPSCSLKWSHSVYNPT
jgi:hypothetical protein